MFCVGKVWQHWQGGEKSKRKKNQNQGNFKKRVSSFREWKVVKETANRRRKLWGFKGAQPPPLQLVATCGQSLQLGPRLCDWSDGRHETFTAMFTLLIVGVQTVACTNFESENFFCNLEAKQNSTRLVWFIIIMAFGCYVLSKARTVVSMYSTDFRWGTAPALGSSQTRVWWQWYEIHLNRFPLHTRGLGTQATLEPFQ